VNYLSAFNSYLAQNDRQLIHFLELESNPAVTRLVADYQKDDRKHHLEVRLILEKTFENGGRLRKEILLDGVKKNIHDAIGHFTSVIFLPQMIQILEGSPDERRRYLNTAISQAVPGYSLKLSDYNQALSQRNALLKMLFERRGDPEELRYWDELLTQKGAFIIQKRIQAIHEIEIHAARIHSRLTNGLEILRLDYRPAFDPIPQAEDQYSLPLQTPVLRNGINEERIRNGFQERLLSLRAEEIARGVTTIGPHRDDVRFLSNGLDLGDFGSRGQMRTALLSLKLAEVAWLKDKTGHLPVMLLDEILAELDIRRRADLLAFLLEQEQSLLTTTDLDLFSAEFVQQSTLWHVEDGKVGINFSPV
jgi:DNA replication and repair protein RecF